MASILPARLEVRYIVGRVLCRIMCWIFQEYADGLRTFESRLDLREVSLDAQKVLDDFASCQSAVAVIQEFKDCFSIDVRDTVCNAYLGGR